MIEQIGLRATENLPVAKFHYRDNNVRLSPHQVGGQVVVRMIMWGKGDHPQLLAQYTNRVSTGILSRAIPNK